MRGSTGWSGEIAGAGDIAAVAGLDDIFIGDTLGDPADPRPLPAITVEEPTISMVFSVNTSPLAGKDGRYLTSRHIKERLDKELLYNVSLRVEQAENREAYRVSARGELQLAVLVETMRREGFELSLSRPKVITRDIDGQLCEPMELAVIDLPEKFIGIVTEMLSTRRGRMTRMVNNGFRTRSAGVRDFFPWADRLSEPVPDRDSRHWDPEYAAPRIQAACRRDSRPPQRRARLRSRGQSGYLCNSSPSAARDNIRESGRPCVHGNDCRGELAR